MKFIVTPYCLAEALCGTCRNLEGGRGWRQQIAERFTVKGVDWPCPKGHEWGFVPEPREATKREPEPEFVATRRKACEACDEEACFLKRMLKAPCKKAFRARIVRPGMVCPLERWPSNRGSGLQEKATRKDGEGHYRQQQRDGRGDPKDDVIAEVGPGKEARDMDEKGVSEKGDPRSGSSQDPDGKNDDRQSGTHGRVS